jgi:UPF0716 family protein affecting phage T7 exclusion
MKAWALTIALGAAGTMVGFLLLRRFGLAKWARMADDRNRP